MKISIPLIRTARGTKRKSLIIGHFCSIISQIDLNPFSVSSTVASVSQLCGDKNLTIQLPKLEPLSIDKVAGSLK
ncbi:hypothetical protein KC960_05535 [Candidatus Saccharibacteria bacterium]|nr:hypothetical protein [Candidatus Saccharibacteria bacterium]